MNAPICTSKKILNSDGTLAEIKRWFKYRKNYEDLIREKYENADEIIKVLEEEGENISLSNFNILETGKESNPQKVMDHFLQSSGNVDIDYGGDKLAVDKMIEDFRRSLLIATVFNPSTNRSVDLSLLPNNPLFADAINEKVYNYKTDLVNKIFNLVNPGAKCTFESPEQFVNTVNVALMEFGNYNGDTTTTAYKDARDAYTVLKNFDNLLKQEAPFIKTKDKYTNLTEGRDKYIYVGPTSETFKTWTTKEEVDMESQVGKMLTSILEIFPKVQINGLPIEGSGISLKEYNQIMTTLKNWIPAHVTAKTIGIEGVNASSELTRFLKDFYRIDLNTNEDYKRADRALYKIIDKFVDSVIRGEIQGINVTTVLGIKNLLHSGVDNEIKSALLNLMFKTEQNRGFVIVKREGTIKNKLIQDNYKTAALYSIYDDINTAIDNYKFKSPDQFASIKEKYNIKIDDNKIEFGTNKYTGRIVIEISDVTNGSKKGRSFILKTGNVNNNTAKMIIEDILGTRIPDNYDSILKQQSGDSAIHTSLFRQFVPAIGIVLQASDTKGALANDNSMWKNGITDDPLRSEIIIQNFYATLNRIATFLGIAWGTNIQNTLKNSFKNNVAAYTLTSMIQQMDRLKLRLSTNKETNQFEGNPVFSQMEKFVGKPIVRLDADVDGNKKAARNMSEAELAHISIMSDFYKSFMTTDEQYIYIQNSCFSDKNTHFIIPYNKNLVIRVNGKENITLSKAITTLLSPTVSIAGEKMFFDAIYSARNSKFKTLLNNLASDWLKVFTNIVNEKTAKGQKVDEEMKIINALSSKNILEAEKPETLKIKLETCKKIQAGLSPKKDAAKFIYFRDQFAKVGIDFKEEFHYSANGVFNETLEHSIDTYVIDTTKTAFLNRLNKQQNLFLKDLKDVGYTLNKINDLELYTSIYNKIGSEWFDQKTETMLLEKEGKLNPLLKAFYYSDILLSNSFNDIIFGNTFFHPNKYKAEKDDIYNPTTGKWNEDYYDHSEASRLLASYKRTVIAGATTHLFMPTKYGVASNIEFAVMEDMPVKLFNMMGVADKMDSMDGAGFSSPVQAMLENMSLFDAKVGYDKKTIFGDVDPKTGMPTLLKWAVFAITNDRRRKSMGSAISLENMFKKMHNKAIDCSKINLKKYYNTDGSIAMDGGRILTERNYIYRKGENSGKYFRIDSVTNNGNNITITETEVNKLGAVIGETNSRKIIVNSLYDLDQIFGGAYAMQMDEKSGTLAYSNVNNKILANLVCHEDMKDKFTGYLVNKSAIKVGTRNLNLKESWTNNNNLVTTKMSLLFGGVQMDADHTLGDDTTVTEMSQMISSLIQGGYFTEEVDNIYSEIGEVVVEALKKTHTFVNNGDFRALHTMLGKELIESFSRGNKDTMGLAQSYLEKAAKILKSTPNADINIPFSDPTLIGAFVAGVNSSINKKGLRRKYAGIAAVQVPSRGMIQYFNYNGKQMTYEKFAREIYNNPNCEYSAKEYIQNHGTYDPVRNAFILNSSHIHPFINEVDPQTVDMGDTVLIIEPGKTEPELVICDNWDDWDRVKHWSNGLKVFKWSCRPVDLRASDTTFVVNGKTHSIYDTDYCRAAHYVRQLENENGTINLNTADQNKLDFIYWTIPKALRSRFWKNNIISGELDAITVNEIKKHLSWAVKQEMQNLDKTKQVSVSQAFGDIFADKFAPNVDLNTISAEIWNRYLTFGNKEKLFTNIKEYIPDKVIFFKKLQSIGQISNDSDIILQYNTWEKERNHIAYNINVRFAEIIMGRVNGKQFGLSEGEHVCDVLEQKEEFFKNKIKSKDAILDGTVDKNLYDCVLKGANGESLYVVVKKNHLESDPITGEKKLVSLPGWAQDNSTFENIDDTIYYKDKPICVSGFKQFYSKPGTSNTNHLVVVDDLSEVSELLKSDIYSRVEYNFNTKNLKDNFMHKYAKYISDDGKLNSELTLREKNRNVVSSRIIKSNTLIDDLLKDSDIIQRLNSEERMQRTDEIDALAKQNYFAFLKQLEYIGARIPTQSMQSFMGLKVVDFSESDVNEVYIPSSMQWLEGSDYDIDKLYIMGFDINNKGELRTFSNLAKQARNSVEFEEVMKLRRPTGLKYIIGDDSDTGLDAQSVQQAIELYDVSAFNKVLRGNDEVIHFQSNVSLNDRYAFVRMLRTHSLSKISRFTSETALKNSVTNNIINLLKHPSVQPLGHQPITMKTYQDIAKKSILSKKERTMTSDDPMTKFIMQMQNMVGKDVIGITAVGMKVFFGVTTFVNMRVNQMVDALKNNNIEDALTYFNDITFTDPYTGEFSTISNINLQPLLDYFSELSDEQLSILNGRTGNITQKVEYLNSIKDRIDTAEGISQLLSCATDNAKELILSKINATTDFADAWSTMMITGHTVEEISDLMQSPIFSIISRFAKNNIFSNAVSGNDKNKVIDFVLGKGLMPGVSGRDLKIIMGAYQKRGIKDNQCFVNKLLYQTYDTTENGHKKGELILDKNGAPIKRIPSIIDETIFLDEKKGVFAKDSEIRKRLFDLLGDTNNIENSTQIAKILLDHLHYLINSEYSKKKSRNEEDEDYDEWRGQEDESSYSEDEESYIDDEELEYKKFRNDDFDNSATYKVDRDSLIKLYNYVEQYVIPKNEQLSIMPDYTDNIEKLQIFADNVRPAIEEQTILGAILGINQGLKTNLYDFIKVLKRVEMFINKRLGEGLSSENRFDIIRFLDDAEYKKTWCNVYDKLKSVYNILKVIDTVPNFKAMYDQNSLAYKLLMHSFRNKLTVELSNKIFDYFNENASATRLLNSDEWDALEKYVRDLILTNWITKQGIKIKLPNGQKFYTKEGDQFTESTSDDIISATGEVIEDNSELRQIDLGTLSGCASFVRYFETYVVPKLKDRYLYEIDDEGKQVLVNHAFFRNLSYWSRYNRASNQKIGHLKLAINSTIADSDYSMAQTYSEILKDFNNVANDQIAELGGMTIKDAFFLYNSLVYKNAFSDRGFTRLFETLSFNNDDSLITNYQNFIASLDSRQANVGDLDTIFTIDQDGFFNLGEVTGNIKDLLKRFAMIPKSAKKFNVAIEQDTDGAASRMLFVDTFGREKDGTVPIDIKTPNASDWTLDMPVLGDSKLGGGTTTAYDGNYNLEHQYYYNSKTVTQEVINTLSAKLGLKVGNDESADIILLQDGMLPNTWGEYQENPDKYTITFKNWDDYYKTKRAAGFIHNGKVFINMNNVKPDTAMHEILHLFCAGLKFSKDEATKDLYYNTMNDVVEYYRTQQVGRYKELIAAYGGNTADFKEELLIEYMTSLFSSKFRKAFGTQKFTADIKSEVINIINEIFGTELKEDINLKKLGNTSIGDFVVAFSSKLIDNDSNDLTMNIVMSQKLKTIKQILMDNAEKSDKKSKIIYNC